MLALGSTPDSKPGAGDGKGVSFFFGFAIARSEATSAKIDEIDVSDTLSDDSRSLIATAFKAKGQRKGGLKPKLLFAN